MLDSVKEGLLQFDNLKEKFGEEIKMKEQEVSVNLSIANIYINTHSKTITGELPLINHARAVMLYIGSSDTV